MSSGYVTVSLLLLLLLNVCASTNRLSSLADSQLSKWNTIVDEKIEKQLLDLELRLARANILYSQLFWKAELSSLVTGKDRKLGIIRTKRGAIGDECQYLLNYQMPRSMTDRNGPRKDHRLIHVINKFEKGIGGSQRGRKPDKEFCCDVQKAECISHLAVCDGIEDCSNGKDELLSVCSTPMEAGMEYVGRKFYNKCYDGFHTEDDIVLVINDVTQKSYFTNQRQVSATFTVITKSRTSVNVVSYMAEGYFNFAHRMLTISSEKMDSARLVFTGKFFGNTWSDWFVGRVEHVTSGIVCAEYRFVRRYDTFNILVNSDIGHFFVEEKPKHKGGVAGHTGHSDNTATHRSDDEMTTTDVDAFQRIH